MKTKYIAYLTDILTKAGYADPAGYAQKIYDLEYKFAEAAWDRAVAREPIITTNRMNYQGVTALSPGFPIDRYLASSGYLPSDTYLAFQVPPTAEEIARAKLTPEAVAKLGGGLPAMAAIMANTPLDMWKAWMTAQFLELQCGRPAQGVRRRELRILQHLFAGPDVAARPLTAGHRPRQQLMGEAVGKIYVERRFSPEAKAADGRSGRVICAKRWSSTSPNLTWMTPATR